MAAISAGLDCYCLQHLQSSLQLALPGFLTPAFPSKHTLKNNADVTPAHLLLSRLFKKLKDNCPSTIKLWNLDQAIHMRRPTFSCQLHMHMQSFTLMAVQLMVNRGNAEALGSSVREMICS